MTTRFQQLLRSVRSHQQINSHPGVVTSLAEQFDNVNKRRSMGRRLIRGQKTFHFSEQFADGTISFQSWILKDKV